MDLTLSHFKKSFIHKMASACVAVTFIFTLAFPPSIASAQGIASTVLNLPVPGAFVTTTNGFNPAIIRGITIDRENPLAFDFIVDRGQTMLKGESLVRESNKMIKYFLAALTTPEDDMWVNLSPYEQNRIIAEGFGQTEMGRDLLAQDYMLKQLTASLVYPEDELGQKFWKRVYERAEAEFGTTEIPMETFNKIWIVPTKAVVYEHGNSAFVVESHLKVMHETDYQALAAAQNMDVTNHTAQDTNSDINTQVLKEILIPEIEKEVNEGEIFANLRQIYNSMILATWYKLNLKNSLLGQVYVNQNKTVGIQNQDKDINQKIYNQYVDAFKTGVYNYIKEDYNPATQETLPKKYFSGGVSGKDLAMIVRPSVIDDAKNLSDSQVQALIESAGAFNVEVRLGEVGPNSNEAALAQAAENAVLDFDASVISDEAMITDPAEIAVIEKEISKQVVREIEAVKKNFNLTQRAEKYISSLLTDFRKEENSEILTAAPSILGKTAIASSDESIAREDVWDIISGITNDDVEAEKADLLAYSKANVVHIANHLNAGRGSSLVRYMLIDHFMGRDDIGAKGTDTGWFKKVVDGKDENGKLIQIEENISVTEFRLINFIAQSEHYFKAIFGEVVSLDSIPPLEAVLDQTYYFDRIDGTIKDKRTYRQILKETTNIDIQPPEENIQPKVPVILESTNELVAYIDGKEVAAPGGHGQVSTDLIQKHLQIDMDAIFGEGKSVISTVVNSDGPNNVFTPQQLGYMAKNNIPFMMMFTRRTPLDAKGGFLVFKEENGVRYPDLMERAEAESTDTLGDFSKQGLTTGRIGRELFNTNNAAKNWRVIVPLLNDLKAYFMDTMGELAGERYFDSIVTADMMKNEGKGSKGKEYTQLETAMGKTIFKINKWFEINRRKDSKIEELLQKHGVDKLVHVLVLEEKDRMKGFTPVKFVWDVILYFFSDHFGLDVNNDSRNMEMTNLRPGHLPGFDFNMDVYKKMDAYDMLFKVLGDNSSMINLDMLTLMGDDPVFMANVERKGTIEVFNNAKIAVDLNSDPIAKELLKSEIVSKTQDGRLILENVRITLTQSFLADGSVGPDIIVDVEKIDDQAMIADLNVKVLEALRKFSADTTVSFELKQAVEDKHVSRLADAAFVSELNLDGYAIQLKSLLDTTALDGGNVAVNALRDVVSSIVKNIGGNTGKIFTNTDEAMLIDEVEAKVVNMDNVGGINLNPTLLDLQIKRDDSGVPLPMMDQPLENMHIQGFLPIIINVTPISNLPLLLGLDDEQSAEFQIGLDTVFDRVGHYSIS